MTIISSAREAIVSYMTKPVVTFVSLVKHGANNTPFAIIKSNEGEEMNKVIQAIRVPKGIEIDLTALMGEGIKKDKVVEDGSYLVYEQVEKSICDPETKSLVAIDTKNNIFAVTYDLKDAKIKEVTDKGAIPFSVHGSVGTTTAAWDAAKARSQFQAYAKGEGDDVTFSKYKKGFALIDGETDTLGSYKLPHHYVQDGKVVSVWKGVTAAMGAIHGARSGGMSADEGTLRGAYNHLASEYKLFDEEPPDFKELVEGTLEKSTVENQELQSTKQPYEVGLSNMWEELMALMDIVDGAVSQSASSAEQRKNVVLAAIENFKTFCEAVLSETKASDVYVPPRGLDEATINTLKSSQGKILEILART